MRLTMWKMVRALGAIAALGMCGMFGATGCDDEGDGKVEDAPIELVGTWTSAFGEETISEARWDGYCQQAIARWDNAANMAVVETLAGEGCSTGFSKHVWIEPTATSFAYCVTTYGHPTADAAASAAETNIDRTNLTTGCSGFEWSQLTRK